MHLDNVPKKCFDFFKSQTPIRSGNARKKTKLRKNVIEANYPYAERLDNGYSSQAPKGMTDPTEEYFRKLTKSIMKK